MKSTAIELSEETVVWNTITENGAISEERLVSVLRMPMSQVVRALTELSLKGLVEYVPGSELWIDAA